MSKQVVQSSVGERLRRAATAAARHVTTKTFVDLAAVLTVITLAQEVSPVVLVATVLGYGVVRWKVRGDC